MSDLKAKDCPECERRFAVIYAERGQCRHPHFCPHCGYEFRYYVIGAATGTTADWATPVITFEAATTGV